MKKFQRSGEYTAVPSDRRILGSFIESGYGRQVPGMWAECIYNRSFRKVVPYKHPTWCWLGLDAEHYNENAPFWHSGYEEHDWEFIGEPEIERTLGEETHKGKSSLLLNNGEVKLCGVLQKGIHLRGGIKYTFRIFLGQRINRFGADASISGFGMNVRALDEKPVKITIGSHETVINAAGDPREHVWEFVSDKDEVCTLSITFDWKGGLILATTSLMPEDNILGWRKDVVEAIREAAPSVVRFPGGCFVSFFDWKTAVGPNERREPMESFYWGGLEENDVGLREFMELSELCGYEAQVCFNMLTSTPFDARCMVEYLNAPADVGYGRLRALDGHPEPWHVRYFECDNEAYRRWNPVQYAEKCVEFAREMRLVTPDAEFMMIGYGFDISHLPMMLEIAGMDINYVIHRDGSPEMVEKLLAVIRAYNEKSGRNIRLVNTEWLPSCASPEPFEVQGMRQDYRWDSKIHNDYNDVFSRHQLSWNYALNGAHRILDYMSYGGEFALANFNNMANTFGQNLIEAAKDKCWLSCMGEVFSFFRRNFVPCTAAHCDTGDENVFALFARDENGREQLYVVNHSSAEKEFALPEGNWYPADGIASETRAAFVTAEEKPVQRYLPETENGILRLKGLSLCCFEKH